MSSLIRRRYVFDFDFDFFFGGGGPESAGIGTPLLFTQQKIHGVCPSFASESSMRELG